MSLYDSLGCWQQGRRSMSWRELRVSGSHVCFSIRVSARSVTITKKVHFSHFVIAFDLLLDYNKGQWHV